VRFPCSLNRVIHLYTLPKKTLSRSLAPFQKNTHSRSLAPSLPLSACSLSPLAPSHHTRAHAHANPHTRTQSLALSQCAVHEGRRVCQPTDASLAATDTVATSSCRTSGIHLSLLPDRSILQNISAHFIGQIVSEVEMFLQSCCKMRSNVFCRICHVKCIPRSAQIALKCSRPVLVTLQYGPHTDTL
jgi:hypothetical protein